MSGAKTYVNILFVIAAATSFARCLTMLRYPQSISQSVLAVSDNKIVILLIMNLIMLVCGMIIDNIPNIMILSPILVPIAAAVGVDPIHFGIIMTCNLAVGMVTPPMGINLFVASGNCSIFNCICNIPACNSICSSDIHVPAWPGWLGTNTFYKKGE